MNISMIIGDTRPTLIQRVNTGVNELYIDGSRIAPSQWVGSGYYTFTKNGNQYSIKKADANVGNITLKIIDDYNYELVQIKESSSSGLTIDNVYPVGSIYMSVNNTNPETLFPNTVWSPLYNRMLIGAGDSYSVNDTGGETTHTLTTAEMPQHNHSPYTYGVSGSGSVTYGHQHQFIKTGYHNHSFSGSSHNHAMNSNYTKNFLAVDASTDVKINGTRRAFPSTSSSGYYFVYADTAGSITEEYACATQTASGTVGYEGYSTFDAWTSSNGESSSVSVSVSASVAEYDRGSSSAHNNMPPYLAVYMWKRVS